MRGNRGIGGTRGPLWGNRGIGGTRGPLWGVIGE